MSTVLHAIVLAPYSAAIETMVGKTSRRNARANVELDVDSLDVVPLSRPNTGTPWHHEPRTLRGPVPCDLLAAIGKKEMMPQIEALNDYVASVPVSDTIHHEVAIAGRTGSEFISVRERGPLFIIDPPDQAIGPKDRSVLLAPFRSYVRPTNVR